MTSDGCYLGPKPVGSWEPTRSPPMEPTQSPAELTKQQRKCRRAKDSHLAKKLKSLETEYNNLKSRMEELEDKITRAYQSTKSRFKRKKIRSMKREADKMRRDLIESKCSLDRFDVIPRHLPSKNK